MEASDVKDYLVRQFRPSAIVFSSPTAKQLCGENNLSPAELLRPFAGIRIKQGNINPDKVSLREFRMDFFDDSEYEPLLPSAQITIRKSLLDRNKPPTNLTEVDVHDETWLKGLKSPWLEIWRTAFLELNQLQIFEMLLQPLGIFYIVTSEENIAESLKSM
eukprot:TRINITY_DN22679_c0_g2_i1.p2 TRINITY_DN22679_c0_g2~~TRINITY_DN22679_c0_g2_i1.p2  ORF type:complete len:161 (-),score=31.84 TRINITY_DN22679_c0_g2_i1:144-626(-)